MSNWFAKTKGKIERLNHNLVCSTAEHGMTVEHTVYGFVTVLTPEDTDCVNLVRDILFELSENHNKKVNQK